MRESTGTLCQHSSLSRRTCGGISLFTCHLRIVVSYSTRKFQLVTSRATSLPPPIVKYLPLSRRCHPLGLRHPPWRTQDHPQSLQRNGRQLQWRMKPSYDKLWPHNNTPVQHQPGLIAPATKRGIPRPRYRPRSVEKQRIRTPRRVRYHQHHLPRVLATKQQQLQHQLHQQGRRRLTTMNHRQHIGIPSQQEAPLPLPFPRVRNSSGKREEAARPTDPLPTLSNGNNRNNTLKEEGKARGAATTTATATPITAAPRGQQREVTKLSLKAIEGISLNYHHPPSKQTGWQARPIGGRSKPLIPTPSF